MKTLLFIFGTRPETIKLAPLILKAKQDPTLKVLVCSTGQHREMIKPLFDFFGISPDYDLKLMKPGQTLADISVGVMSGLQQIFQTTQINAVIVQGDTTSCFIGSLISFYHQIPVMHIEAGLRSGDIYSPFPEEFNRKAIGLIAHTHFAPTELAKENLVQEKVQPKDVFVTGNTGIDALFAVLKKLSTTPELKNELDDFYSFIDLNKKLILATVHRRESFGAPLEEIFHGLLQLSQENDLQILIPLHMNPQVRNAATKIFAHNAQWITKGCAFIEKNNNRICLLEPVDYVPFVYLMNRAHLIITDSGGVQEEAPSLGKPILVAREKTERPEAIAAGTSKLIPLERRAFVQAALEVLKNPMIYNSMSEAKKPFGDGTACEKILPIIKNRL